MYVPTHAYMQVVKTMGICLLYAPLYPPLYLLAAAALAVALFANKWAISFTWGRPPSVGEDMMERLRLALALLLPLHWASTAWAASAAGSDHLTWHAWVPLIAASCTWIFFLLSWRLCCGSSRLEQAYRRLVDRFIECLCCTDKLTSIRTRW